MNPYELDLKKLNSATKYPSILTYHTLGERGRLTEEVQVSFNEDDQWYTEKIDGTNSRIIVFPGGDFFIGSREELLHFGGDLVYNPSQGIVDAVLPLAHEITSSLRPGWEFNGVTVFFGETYGHRIGKNGKQYSQEGNVGFRLFDVMNISEEALYEILTKDLPDISIWRDKGGQPFETRENISRIAHQLEIILVPGVAEGEPLPTSIEETYEWLRMVLPGQTKAALDGEGGKPEGIVVRSEDRSKIAKIRFEDYERTLRARQ